MSWWRRAQAEEHLDKELRFHLDQHTADLITRGHKPQEARRLARISLGGPEQVKEQCRDVRPTRWMEDLGQDLRYALRTLGQRRGFAAVALLTLALGTGATTVMFTVINGVLLKPLAFADPGRLIRLQDQTDWSTSYGNLWAFTYPNYLDCKRESRSLTLAVERYGGGTVSAPGDPEYVNSNEISADLFPMLGARLFLGRNFLVNEDRPGAPAVAIISYELWQRRFGGNPQALGMQIVFAESSYTVIGVTGPDFRLDYAADVFTPIGQNTGAALRNRQAHFGFEVWGRLQPGATLAQAQAEMTVIARQLAAQYPQSNKGRTFNVEPLRPNVGNVRSMLWLLLGAVTLVLLIACANIASLLLARAVSRERELSMRVALGAGRSRLARQCLTESAVLGLGGGALGILIAVFGVRPFIVFWPGSLPRAEEVHFDWHVLLFALVVSLGSGLVFGLAPALRVGSRDLEQSLRAGARSLTGNSRRLHGVFVISEIALAMVLLVCAGMLGRTMLRLSSLDPGLNVHNILTARTGLAASTLRNPAPTRAAWQDILDRARNVPGVEAIAMVDTVPMREGNNQIPYSTTPAPPPSDKPPSALANSVTPDYLKVMGIPLRAGRFIADQDRMGNESVAVIDEVMAQQAFPGENPIGKHIWMGIAPDPATVIGVVGHVRQFGPAGDDHAAVRAQLYYPFAQVPDALLPRWSQLMSIAVRTGVQPLSVVESLRREIRGAARDQVIYEVRTMEQLSAAALARQRFLLLLFGIFAGLALLLACIGIYGVLAYLTSRRVPEIGVRMALGASRGTVIQLILRQSLGMILSGIAVGILAAFAASRVLARMVEGMRPAEPATLAAIISILLACALFASFLPARRASRIDPMKALRQD